METKKRKNGTILFTFLIITFLVVLGIVFMLPSAYKKGLNELRKCKNTKEVKAVWDRYSSQLISDQDFEKSVRDKLSEFSLSSGQIDSCLLWLPKTPTHLNLIVIPDLSNRLQDSSEFEIIKEEDVDILKMIRNEFRAHAGNRKTKNRFVVTLPHSNHIDSKIRTRLNNLFLDMEHEVNSPSEPFFTTHQKSKFNQNISELYDLSKSAELKQDFFSLFKFTLESYLVPSTLYDRFTNKIVILTNGSILTDKEVVATKVDQYEQAFRSAQSRNEMTQIIHKNKLRLPTVHLDLSETNVLICQIDFNKDKEFFYQEVFSAYWADWFGQMGTEPEIVFRNFPPNMLKRKISDFIKRD